MVKITDGMLTIFYAMTLIAQMWTITNAAHHWANVLCIHAPAALATSSTLSISIAMAFHVTTLTVMYVAIQLLDATNSMLLKATC
jgi:hypothetical protein